MLLLRSSSALALNPALDISQYAHTAWRIRDGFPKGPIYAIAQTPDGYLWLGTDEGLLRFDGVRAVPVQWPGGQRLPSDRVSNLLSAKDGRLWIGTDKGLASWKEGKLTRYRELDEQLIGKLVEDREHSLWLTTASLANYRWSLCAVRGVDVECYGGDGGPGSGAIGLYEDSRGALWVGTSSGLWRWHPGPPAFVPLRTPPNGLQGFSESDDGTLWLLFDGGVVRLVDGQPQMVHPLPPSLRPKRLLRDRDGALWIATEQGLAHVHGGSTDVFGEADGLTSNTTTALFEDREGNIWVATYEGLHRFRATAVAAV